MVTSLDPATKMKVSTCGETVEVDLATCTPQAELLDRVRRVVETKRGCDEVELGQFPGGAAVLRSLVALLEASSTSGHCDQLPQADLRALQSPPLCAGTLGDYLEAAAALGSPRLLYDLARSSVCDELTSRLALPYMERLLLRTADPGDDAAEAESSLGAKSSLCEGLAREGPLSEEMEQAFAHVIGVLSIRVDPRDFRLGPALAGGGPRASLEVLRCYRARLEDDTSLDETIRSTCLSHAGLSVSGAMSAAGTSSTRVGTKSGRPLEWTEHEFALYVLRRHLERDTRKAVASGTARQPPSTTPEALLPGAEVDNSELAGQELSDSDEGPALAEEEDISEELCDIAPDAALVRVAGFVVHLDTALLPPILAAALVRGLLASGREERADALFQVFFTRSPKMQSMVVDRQIPAGFLRGVSKHRAASVTLRRMLSRYETADPVETCSLLEDLLFAEFMEEPHSCNVIIRHSLTRDLVFWLRSGGAEGGNQSGALAYAGDDADNPQASIRMRMRNVGVRLFSASFVEHDGFLPSRVCSKDCTSDFRRRTGLLAEDRCLSAATLDNEGCYGGDASECGWDTGALDPALLAHTPAAEDALQLVRYVLLHCLRRRYRHADAQSIARLWPLGRWTLCRDPLLIGEAFRFLVGCWRALAALPGLGDIAGTLPPSVAGGTNSDGDEGRPVAAGDGAIVADGAMLVGSGSRRVAEDLVFQMFSDLELWRLPNKDLLTPWVPGQVVACHVAAQCKQLEDRQKCLVEETRENLEEIARLHVTIAQLTARLEATDARSQQCMQKQSDLNDTLRQLR